MHFDNGQFEIPGGQVPNLDMMDSSRQELFNVDRYSNPRDQDHMLKNSENFGDLFSASFYNPTSFHRRRSSSGTPQVKSNGTMLNSRMHLMVFIKIMLKCLETSDPFVHRLAKRVIAECTKKNREGHPDYTPLEDAIERRLRFAVDDCHWNRAESLMEHYIMMQSRKQTSDKPFKSKSPCYAQV
jgi:hypothetical protein